MSQTFTKHLKTLSLLMILIFTTMSVQSQEIVRTKPVWWFGVSGAANFNTYRGTTQLLNQQLTVPTAFHKGNGIKPYASVLTEVRGKVWGGMLNVAYDNRGGKFDEVIAPCNCPANLTTNLGYVTIEPSLRIAPFASAFYIFAGPTIAFNVTKTFSYMQLRQPDTKADWSDLRKTVLSAQAGLGIDIPVSNRLSETQLTISPFASFQTDLGNSPRTIETWSIYTIRAGIALKIGTKKRAAQTPSTVTLTDTIYKQAPALDKEVFFSVRAPKLIPETRRVKETFPLRKSIFFNMGSSEIPNRYVLLSQAEAASFKESQLQEGQPEILSSGRAKRQMDVYHNIINILGDRMRANNSITMTLVGSSDNNPEDGKLMAENVKLYLVNNFGIASSRISTEGRDKPLIPSEKPGGTRELDLLREGDRRVDIVSTSSDMLLQVGGENSDYLKPVEITAYQLDPLDTHVIFTNQGAVDVLTSWKIEMTDEKGAVQYYGPYFYDQASVPGKTILKDDKQGNYKVAMIGQTKSGVTVRKESSVSLMKSQDVKEEGLRYSVLYEFDDSKTKAHYEKFLIEIVAPLITDNSTVIIHGHTDIIGEEKHNFNLSVERAKDAEMILDKALNRAGKKGVKFETYGFGEEASMSPFNNSFPEERFYNRTVIIDIIPAK